MVKQKLQSIMTELAPGVNLNGDLSKQFDSVQIAHLLGAIENEFSVSLSTFEVILLNQMTLENLETMVSAKLNQ
jgi:acyl carrier protein